MDEEEFNLQEIPEKRSRISGTGLKMKIWAGIADFANELLIITVVGPLVTVTATYIVFGIWFRSKGIPVLKYTPSILIRYIIDLIPTGTVWYLFFSFIFKVQGSKPGLPKTPLLDMVTTIINDAQAEDEEYNAKIDEMEEENRQRRLALAYKDQEEQNAVEEVEAEEKEGSEGVGDEIRSR